MNIVKFAEDYLKVKLTYYQRELLTRLQENPQAFIMERPIKRMGRELRQVIEAYTQFHQYVFGR